MDSSCRTVSAIMGVQENALFCSDKPQNFPLKAHTGCKHLSKIESLVLKNKIRHLAMIQGNPAKNLIAKVFLCGPLQRVCIF